MYATKNYQSKKELVADFVAGIAIPVFQPGGMFPLREGAGTLEGPHYPQPHRFYLQVVQKGGVLVSIKGAKIGPAAPKVPGKRPSPATIEAAARRGDGSGWCISCWAKAHGVEPDACGYTCKSCGASKVFGAEELLF